MDSQIGNLTGEYSLHRMLVYSLTKAVCLFSSALGVHDGNVYESLWDRVQAEPLNKTEVPPGYQVRIDRIGLCNRIYESLTLDCRNI